MNSNSNNRRSILSPRNIGRRIKNTSLPIFSRPQTKPLVISQPYGRVLNTRGEPMTRSESLIVVNSINDIISDPRTNLKGESSPFLDMPESRQASVGEGQPSRSVPLLQLRPPSGENYTGHLLFSDGMKRPDALNRSIPVARQAPSPARPPLNTSRPVLNIPRPGLNAPRSMIRASATAYTLSNLPTIHQDENTPSVGTSWRDKPLPDLPKSNLPKSRTTGALHDLDKTKVSRPLLSNVAGRTGLPLASGKKPAESSLPLELNPRPTASQHDLRQKTSVASLGSTSYRSDVPDNTSCCSSVWDDTVYDPISTAQSSQWWSGRFMGLKDRLLCDSYLVKSKSSLPRSVHRSSDTLATIDTPTSGYKEPQYYQPTKLSKSMTTSAIPMRRGPSPTTKRTADLQENEKQVFLRLRHFCTTDEARESLHDWQLRYARLHGRGDLVPEGETLEERGLVSKIFGNGGNGTRSRLSKRVSISALRELASSRLGKKSAPRLSETQSKRR